MAAEVEAGEGGVQPVKDASLEQEVQEPDISLEMLPLIKEAQNQHGLRHGDYQRYRMYCSRRLRRIRKALHFTQGHRNRYQKKPITVEKVTDARYLCIQLFCAERSWAMSMELKQAANTEPRKRFHLLRRLKRAGMHALELSRLCEECERCDARTRLEAQAYNNWMQGNITFELQKWQEALDAFGQSRAIYEKLAGAVQEDQGAVYTQRVEDIAPNIRYCLYNIGENTDINQLMAMRNVSDMLASKVNLVLAKTQEKAATSLTEITWLGKKVPVRSERLRVSLVKLQLVEGELGRAGEAEKKMEVYETVLMECQDAMQTVKDEISTETAVFEKKKSSKGEVQLGHLHSIVDYLTHVKLTHAIHRNLLLIDTMLSRSGRGSVGVAGAGKPPGGKVSKPEEFVRVYDILLQHVNDMGDIPGLSEDLTNQKENAARTFAFKAFRCYHLAESYVVMKKWAESMGLLDRALEHVGQALEQYRELKVGTEDIHRIDKALLPSLTELQGTVRGRKCEVHVESILESEPPEEAMASLSLSSKPLTERLDQFSLTAPGVKPVLAPLPPNYQPIPHKPLFFDLALNHMEYPSLEHRVEKKAGGITGFVKGLFWGKNS